MHNCDLHCEYLYNEDKSRSTKKNCLERYEMLNKLEEEL